MKIQHYYRPASVDDAYQKLIENPKNVLLAGGFWLKKMNQNYDTIIDLSSLNLNEIHENDDFIIVGSMVSQRQFENSKVIQNLFNDMAGFAVREIMSVPFRNSATIGGSIMGRYPFSDVITALLTMDVTLRFYPKQEMSLADYLNYKGKFNSVLVDVLIKKEKGKGFFKKVKTTALDFPLINFAISKSDKYRIAIGSRPMVGALAISAMEYLNSLSNPSEEDFIKASEIAINELTFLDSVNISKEYRIALAKTYIKRGLLEVSK